MKIVMRAFAALPALSFPGRRSAQQYPTKPVKIIIPFPAGGVTDIAGRLIAQKLSERLGQQFFIENIAGAGGNLGMGKVARAPGDGYTILLSSSSIVVNPACTPRCRTTSTRTSSRSPRPAARRTPGSSIRASRPRR